MSVGGGLRKLWSNDPRWRNGLVALIAFMVAVKIAIALSTYGTNDVFYSESFLRSLRRVDGAHFYSAVPKFNLPPLFIHYLDGVGRLRDATGLPFSFVFRLPGILADAGSVWLVFLIFRRAGDRSAAIRAGVVCLAPAWILISGFHGQIDGIMIFFVLLSVYLLDEDRSLIWAGCALGLALNMKAAAILFVPVLVFYIRPTPKRLRFLAAAGITWILSGLPYIATQPLTIIRRVLGYTSIYGHWGLGRLGMGFDSPINRPFSRYGGFVILVLLSLVAFVLNRKQERPSLFVQCGLSAFVFMSLTPGFAVQYLAWLAPWVVVFGTLALWSHYVTTGAFLIAVYTRWSGGFPWHYANSIRRPGWYDATIGLEVLAWAVIALIAINQLVLNLRRGSRPDVVETPAPGRALAD